MPDKPFSRERFQSNAVADPVVSAKDWLSEKEPTDESRDSARRCARMPARPAARGEGTASYFFQPKCLGPCIQALSIRSNIGATAAFRPHASVIDVSRKS